MFISHFLFSDFETFGEIEIVNCLMPCLFFKKVVTQFLTLTGVKRTQFFERW